jgi:hypothetical protein
MFVRVHVLLEMSNTNVVSMDCPIPITLLTPPVLSVRVPPVAEMWIPFPPGHPAIVPVESVVRFDVVTGNGVGRGGAGRTCASTPVPTTNAVTTPINE